MKLILKYLKISSETFYKGDDIFDPPPTQNGKAECRNSPPAGQVPLRAESPIRLGRKSTFLGPMLLENRVFDHRLLEIQMSQPRN